MPAREFARQSDDFLAVCDAPDHCRTPPGDVPVPYQVTARLGQSVSVSPNVRYGGLPVVLVDESSIPAVTGNEAGTGGGVRSGVNEGELAFTAGAATVRANGRRMVRHQDAVAMNTGNTTGKVLAQAGHGAAGGITPGGRPVRDCDPLGRMGLGPPGRKKAFTHPGAMSGDGVEWLKRLEGSVKEGDRHVLYDDSRGFATIGYGHLVARKGVAALTEAERAPFRDGWTEPGATAQFRQDLKWVEDGIHGNVPATLTKTQFDALVSLGFNAGRSALVRSAVVQAILAGDYGGAARAIRTFRTGGGNTVRRACEAGLFRDGVYYAGR